VIVGDRLRSARCGRPAGRPYVDLDVGGVAAAGVVHVLGAGGDDHVGIHVGAQDHVVAGLGVGRLHEGAKDTKKDSTADERR
jgi:hypothetical protein